MPPSPSISRNNRRAPTTASGPRLGIAGSLALHIAILSATFATWQHKLVIPDQTPPVVPVDLVTIGPKTDIAPMARMVPKLEPKMDLQPAAPDMLKPPALPPPQKAELAPDIPKPKPEKKVEEKPEKPQKVEKKDKFDINNIMALLDKQKPAASTNKAKLGPRDIKGIGAQNAMTMDLVDALRNQIAQCWSPPVGAPHPEQLVVSFELFLNPDGTVAQPPQLSSNYTSDPFMRAAAEAARRAILTCGPYKLPPDRYSQWRDIQMTFDPRLMVGQ